MTRTIRIGSRKSKLALIQSESVKTTIERDRRYRGEIVSLDTAGDKFADEELPAIGRKGLFTRELEERLLDGSLDIAVHSLKDLPTELPEGLSLVAVSKRVDARDALLSRNGVRFDELPPGARLATGSARRRAQILHKRRDVEVVGLRGNVPTRIAKLGTGGIEAIVLAQAGLIRLGLQSSASQVFGVDEMIPAPGQGALGIEARSELGDLAEICSLLNHEASWRETSIERAILGRLGGGCLVPIGIHSRISGSNISVHAFVSDEDGEHFVEEHAVAPLRDAGGLAEEVSDRLIRNGALRLIEKLKRSA